MTGNIEPQVRRVVTGHDGDKAVLWIDEQASNHRFPNSVAAATQLWSSVGTPADFLDDEDGGKRQLGTAPPEAGTRLTRLELAPSDFVPPLHRSDTLDYTVIVSGNVTLYLDDGVETVLGAGDVIVQRRTNHAWANHGPGNAVMVGVLIDGAPKREGSLHGGQKAT